MRYAGDVAKHYFVAGGPFGGRANSQGDKFSLRVMSEDEDQEGWGVRMTATTIAGPFSTEERAREVLSSIIMACPEYNTDDKNLPTWEMVDEDVKITRRKMGLS